MNLLTAFAFLLLAPFFIFLLKEKRFWRLIIGALAFRAAYSLLLTHYVFDPALYGWSLAIFLGLPVAVYFFKKWFSRLPLGLNALAFAVLYLIFDYWAMRYSLIPAFIALSANLLSMTDFIGLARLGGIWILGGTAVLFVALAAAGIAEPNKKRKIAIFFIIFVLAVSSFGFSQSVIRKKEFSAQNARFVKLAAVSIRSSFDEEADLIKEKLAVIENDLKNDRFDLVVFPEGFFDLEVSDLENDENFRLYRELSKRLETALMVNINWTRDGKRYNSNLLIDRGQIADFYDKKDLVFAGEYLPSWLGKSKYSAGERETIFKLGDEVLFAAPICFETHFPKRVRDFFRKGAQFLVNSSSNKWLSERLGQELSASLEHYLELSIGIRKIYAVQHQKPILISGRNDYAGLIFPDGTVDLVDFKTPNGYNIYKGRIQI